jgi:hypothetical protein
MWTCTSQEIFLDAQSYVHWFFILLKYV